MQLRQFSTSALRSLSHCVLRSFSLRPRRSLSLSPLCSLSSPCSSLCSSPCSSLGARRARPPPPTAPCCWRCCRRRAQTGRRRRSRAQRPRSLGEQEGGGERGRERGGESAPWRQLTPCPRNVFSGNRRRWGKGTRGIQLSRRPRSLRGRKTSLPLSLLPSSTKRACRQGNQRRAAKMLGLNEEFRGENRRMRARSVRARTAERMAAAAHASDASFTRKTGQKHKERARPCSQARSHEFLSTAEKTLFSVPRE